MDEAEGASLGADEDCALDVLNSGVGAAAPLGGGGPASPRDAGVGQAPAAAFGWYPVATALTPARRAPAALALAFATPLSPAPLAAAAAAAAEAAADDSFLRFLSAPASQAQAEAPLAQAPARVRGARKGKAQRAMAAPPPPPPRGARPAWRPAGLRSL